MYLLLWSFCHAGPLLADLWNTQSGGVLTTDGPSGDVCDALDLL